MAEARSRNRLVAVTLDPQSIGVGTADQEHERRTAIYDLVETNAFRAVGHPEGPYRLTIGLHETKLAFDIRDEDHKPIVVHLLSLKPLRSLLRDYMMLCDSYIDAIRRSTPAQIEAIDMGRRGLHNEAAERLAARLDGKIEADFDTMRRLFTLITALHWKG